MCVNSDSVNNIDVTTKCTLIALFISPNLLL